MSHWRHQARDPGSSKKRDILHNGCNAEKARQGIYWFRAKVKCGYYYFDFRNSQKSLASSMLRSLLHQFITRTSTSPEAIEKLRSNYPAPNLAPVSELAEILKQQYSIFDTTFLFIDALDECDKVDELLHVLTDMSRNTGSSADVRFMCFSRDQGAIKRALESSGFLTRPLEQSVVVQDIATYVRETLRDNASGKFRVFQNSPKELREDVLNMLVRKSEGM
ncbi:hypothetical protein IL306_011352 [Fusarium sp. DS 682]|nr:hypothetical protein IL306_011352 [Fusarium sp. DS 682]